MSGDNKLSDKQLKALLGKTSEKQKMIADGRGLSVRLSKSGGVSFVFSYRVSGRKSAPVWLTLGRYPDLSLLSARRLRDKCREWLADHLDPRRQIRIMADVKMNPVTVKDAVLYWYDHHASIARKEHEYLIKRFDKHIFPFIGEISIEKCSIKQWLDCFDRIRVNAPVMSGAIFLDVKQALRFCRVRQYIKVNPFGDVNVNHVGSLSRARDRVLSETEISDVWNYAFGNNILNVASNYMRRIIVLCLVFGCRQQEARKSTWDEWDLVKWIWTVPKEHSKNGEEIARPIPQGIRQWIVNLHAETEKHHYIVGRELKRATVTGGANRISKRLGHEKLWCVHDFRRTFSTGLNDMGADPYIVELLLGHKINGIAGVYNKSKHLKKKAEIMEMWVDYLNTVSGFNDNVISLNKKAV
ncbi:site-specific integrase [Erwinia endophytica]|nr:site-specific integrase [Erwinia endophytica]